MSSGEQFKVKDSKVKDSKGVSGSQSVSEAGCDKQVASQSDQSEPEPCVSTPKSGVKRVLTPSPVIRYQFLKKSRQLSGGTASMDDDRSVEEMLLTEGAIVEQPEYVSVPLPLDPQDVATELKQQMLPEIKALIQRESPDINSIVRNAVDSAVERINETLMKEINSLQKKNEELSTENKDLKESVIEMKGKIKNLEQTADDCEQYSRRNSIRITGRSETNNEDTDKIVLDMARDLDIQLTLADIDRTHRVGKVRDGRKRAILVKFATYRARRNLYSKRMELRNKPQWQGTYINEDLTVRRSELLYKARLYVRARLLKSSYSSDGRIYVKDRADRKHLITLESDLQAFGTIPQF